MRQASKRQRRIQNLDDAWEEIAKLPTSQRELLCRAALTYFSSPAAVGMMDMLGNLPENHPRKIINKYRVAWALLQLLELGVLPKEVVCLGLAAEEWYKLEPL